MKKKDTLAELPFGAVISSYSLDQAIEDGIHVDFGFMESTIGKIRIVATTSFMKAVSTYEAMHILLKTLKHIQPQLPNWIVFTGEDVKEHTEDAGRTLKTTVKALEETVYAILDDHKDHYVLTFLLATEY